jgi:hypothetical protein
MRHETTKAVGIFLALAGLVGSVVQLLTTEGGLGKISLTILFASLLALGAWVFASGVMRKWKAAKALPQVSQLEDICAGYYMEPATAADVDWIARLEAQVYTAADAVPGHVLREWYESNPDGFNIIRMRNGERVGHIDLLPLRPATLRKFLEGTIVEKDIRGDSLYPPSERAQIKDLYVESIIVLPPKGYSNAPAILCVLTNFAALVERVCDPAQVESIYAMAASSSGERLLKRLGFDLLTPGDQRADRHGVFCARFGELSENIITICSPRFPGHRRPTHAREEGQGVTL